MQLRLRRANRLSSAMLILFVSTMAVGGSRDGDRAPMGIHLHHSQATPSIGFSTYFGGGSDDQVNAMAVDASGNVYVGGTTYSRNFPIKNAIQKTYRGLGDGFVAKIDSQGSLVFSTYLGGSGLEQLLGLAVDGTGCIYVTGITQSANFPVTVQGYQKQLNGLRNAFVSKLDPAGGLVYSTYLGGGSDGGHGISIDRTGNAIVVGVTATSNFPTRNAFRLYSGDYDGFVTKLNASGSGLIYSTYLGGSDRDEAHAVAVDRAGNAYVTGVTRSSYTFPQKRKLFGSHPGSFDGFVTKLTPAGALVYSVFFGGSEDDFSNAIAVSNAGNVYIAGYTSSTDLPLKSALQTDFGGAETRGFLTKINSQGTGLIFSTYMGGGDGLNGIDAIVLDSNANVYVAGGSDAQDMPVADPVQDGNHGGTDAILAKIGPFGRSLIFSTYLGGGNGDVAHAVARDSFGRVYLAGVTLSVRTFPLVKPLQNHYGGGPEDGFIARIDNIP